MTVIEKLIDKLERNVRPSTEDRKLLIKILIEYVKLKKVKP